MLNNVGSQMNTAIDNASIYDAASIYSLGAAGYNAAQPLPSYINMKRLSLPRMSYDDTAMKMAEKNVTSAQSDALRGFQKSTKGIGTTMAMTASVANNTANNLNQIGAQKMQAKQAVDAQNVQIAGQEASVNTEISNQETLTNEQMRAQSEQLKAQMVKSNLDSAFTSQFQEKQLEMQQATQDKQAGVQKNALDYMVNIDKYYQTVNSPEATRYALDKYNTDADAEVKKIGSNVDEFMMLNSDSEKDLIDKRTRALSKFDKDNLSKETLGKLDTRFKAYTDAAQKWADIESGKEKGLEDMSADERKDFIAKKRLENDKSLEEELMAAKYNVDDFKKNGAFSYDDEVKNKVIKNLQKSYVDQMVYQPEVSKRRTALSSRMNDYKSQYAKSLGIPLPDVNKLLTVIK
jgi:hypothetical protein